MENNDDMISFDKVSSKMKKSNEGLVTESDLSSENNILYQMACASNKKDMCLREIGYYDEEQGKPLLSIFKRYDPDEKKNLLVVSHIYTDEEREISIDKNRFCLMSLLAYNEKKEIANFYSVTFLPKEGASIEVTKRREPEIKISGQFVLYDDLNEVTYKEFDKPMPGHDMLFELISLYIQHGNE